MDVREETNLKISYTIAGSLITMLVMIGIWVGTHAARLTNVEARVDRQVTWIKETNSTVDKRFDTLDERVYQIWTTVVPEEKRRELSSTK
jgi:hypothetical protein